MIQSESITSETAEAVGSGDTDQAAVLDFLGHGDWAGGPVDRVDTHGAYVFLADDTALKVKRAVTYDYMDLSTLWQRGRLLRRELELNRRGAPQIYRDVVAVTRESDGSLAINGDGSPVEWALRMARFPKDAELPEIAGRGDLTDDLAAALGRTVHAYHAETPVKDDDGADLMRGIAQEFRKVFADMGDVFGDAKIADFDDRLQARIDAVADLLTRRSRDGRVRRAHGDLHLANIVVLDGDPVLFDALEFDETLGTCDVLYDLAFLLMDLLHRDHERAADIVLTTYLHAADGAEDEGLAALPLFLAVRAAIRAMVSVQTDRANRMPGRSDGEANAYLDAGLAWLDPPAALLLAVGGPSGTGKTDLSRSLAPGMGAAPGAVHLRTDTERDPAQGYDDAARAAVYARMMGRAEALVAAGQSVVLDATFTDRADRDAAAVIAKDRDVPFTGLWLTAPTETLVERVEGRDGDASDADADVVRRQMADGAAAPEWHQVAADRPADETLAAVRAVID